MDNRMELRQVLIYSDSLSWGIIPDSRRRLSFEDRWPGACENNLNASGLRVTGSISILISIEDWEPRSRRQFARS